MKDMPRSPLLALAIMLSACGGASDKHPGSESPTIQILSPSDGQVVANGDRKITVSGTGFRMASVTVKLNGAVLPASAMSSTDSTFAADLELANNSNDIEVIATSADGSTASATISVVYPFVTFSSFQPASVIVGQEMPNAIEDSGVVDRNTLSSPAGRALVIDGKLYLPDTDHNRVLVYNSIPTANDANADMVLGQQTFNTATPETFRGPETMASDGNRLLVVNAGSFRVVIFDPLPTSPGQSPEVTVGLNGCAQNSMYFPRSIFTVNGKLIVADTNNNRLLIWNSIPTVADAPADVVLGQETFDSCYANAGPAGSVSANAFAYPTDVWSDGTRLVVTDTWNNRVLIWNTFPKDSSTPADVVLGHSVMTVSDPEDPQTGLNDPWSVSSNGNQLFVADARNNRVLVWNTFPTKNDAPADVVLGQSDFTHVTYNDDPQTGGNTSPSARTLNWPAGVALWGNQLFVADRDNNRYLIYDGQ
jgi:hypothetical protein